MNKETTNEIKNYFTDDIREQVNQMTNEDMKTILKGLEGTPTWFAILKYSQERIVNIQSSFLTLDPVKVPTDIARYQGVITGLLDLQDAVLSLKFKAEQVGDPKQQEDKDKEALGGAYGVV